MATDLLRTNVHPMRARPALAGVLAAVLAACSGPGDDPYRPGTDLPASEAEVVRFLNQASYGADDATLARLNSLGYATWLQEQQELAPSLHRPEVEARALTGLETTQDHRQAMWWRRALTARDQLRQRMAFALSEIFVISDRNDALGGDVVGMAEYYDVLVRHAFGNYRDLLEAVTLSPQMGKYLSHLRNRKPDPARNIRPDENYAREVMQLFSIGLVELNADGSARLDGSGQTIPTYEQEDIVGLAHVFTGWNQAGATSFFASSSDHGPMQPWENYHDRQSKLVLGTTFPAGQDAAVDLDMAMDLLAGHPNVGPFLGKQLIQRFVTSNPSPAYVARIAAVWANDGAGVRGNLCAVLRAILLDTEARTPPASTSAAGKLREPLLRQSALWRALRPWCRDGSYLYGNPDAAFGQAALRSPSVFNFFRPDYSPQGELADAGLLAPEFEILGHNTTIATANQFYASIYNRRIDVAGTQPDQILIDVAPEVALAADVDALIDHLDRRLLAGSMTAALRSILRTHLEGEADGTQRALDAIYLIATSPEFAVQK